MLRRWLQRAYARLITTTTHVRGLPVTVVNTRPEIETEDVLRRLDEALALIERYTPHYFRHLRRDFAGIVVKRYACRGAYFPITGTCLIELTFSINPDFTPAQVAAVLVHEGMHARLHRLGLRSGTEDRPRHERCCRRAEVELGRAVPGGAAVVERALEILANADEDVAPAVDERLATQRITEADLRAWSGPRWLRRALARRHGGSVD